MDWNTEALKTTKDKMNKLVERSERYLKEKNKKLNLEMGESLEGKVKEEE